MIENNNGDWAVLFVDDEEKALKYFAKAVGSRFPVITASNVESAEAILEDRNHEIAVVISDQRMPGKNGVELLKKVRTEYPAMVRLLTTAYSDLNDAIEAINRGEIYRYIQKPWHLDSLQAEVKGAVDYFLLRRERDLLLAEKLSARQRMTAVDRLAKLIVFAKSQQSLRDSGYALRNFLNYLHRLPGTRESDGFGNVDQWELTKWESRRISDYLQQVCSGPWGDVAALQYFDDQFSSAQFEGMINQLAGEHDLEFAVSSNLQADSKWSTNLAILEDLLRRTFALTGELQPQRLASISVESSGPQVALHFRIEGIAWPAERHLLTGSALTDVHPVYGQLLAASLAAAHLGGGSALDLEDDVLTLLFDLPLEGGSKEGRPDLGWDWLPEALTNYEPDIDEFYDDL